jgi:outer membrane protein assembly factor BamE (lipoprotein component of BamABCDE complex)
MKVFIGWSGQRSQVGMDAHQDRARDAHQGSAEEAGDAGTLAMRRRALILLLSLLPFMAGCVITYGREFDTTKVSQIVAGKTTKEEVRAMLGEPASTAVTADFEQWTYAYEKRLPAAIVEEIFGKGTYGSTARPELTGGASLTVTFDKSGVVVDYALVK